MSKIDNLLRELCPEGVERVSIGSVVNYEQPTSYIVSSAKYNDLYPTPVLTAGQTFILGYTNEPDGIYQASKENPVIIFDDFTGALKWVDFPFKVKSSAMKMLKSNNDSVKLRYIYHVMSNMGFSSSEHKRLWIGTYSNLLIPLPPLPIQREIVRILDTFSELTSELTAELALRKKQYAFYRDKLLSFDESVERVSIGSVVDYEQSTNYIVSSTKYNDAYPTPVLTAGQTFILGYTNEPDGIYQASKENPVIIFDDFTGALKWVDFPFKVKSSAMKMLKSNNDSVKLRYIYHVMSNMGFSSSEHKRLWIGTYSNFSIPLPPLSEQQRIVAILDRFDTLCNDLTSGIPAEIEARKEQYAYYRDLLLRFDRVA